MKKLLALLLLLCSGVLYAQDDSVSSDYEYDDAEYSDSEYEDDEYSEETHNPLSPEDVSRKKGYPEEAVDVQRFDRDKWKKVVGDEDFSEVESKKKKRKSDNLDSLRTADSNKRMFDDGDDEEEEDQEPSSSSLNIPGLNYIFYALAIGIIGYILYVIIKNTSIRSSTKITRDEQQDAAAPVEDIKELEIDRLLREAMTAGNYRLAIRIYFLGLLKKLDEDGLITWKRNKTNRDYLTELFSKARYYDEVQRLTLAYEEVWYGDHTFSTQTYEEIISSFRTIEQKLNADRTQ
ncbi:MAG TPA: DUF4129 domain-containing protein [Chryseosolibacter sp.]